MKKTKTASIGDRISGEPEHPNIGPDTAEVQAAADVLGLRVHVLTASNERELEVAFEKFKQQRLDAMLVGIDTWYREHPGLIVQLAARHRGWKFDRRIGACGRPPHSGSSELRFQRLP